MRPTFVQSCDAETYHVKAGIYTLFAATGCLLLIACLQHHEPAGGARGDAAQRDGDPHRTWQQPRPSDPRAGNGEPDSHLRRRGVGFLLAAGILQWLLHARLDIPRDDTIHIDGIVVLFATGIMLVCGLLAGLSTGTFLERQAHSASAAGVVPLQPVAATPDVRLRRLLLSLQIGADRRSADRRGPADEELQPIAFRGSWLRKA